MENSIVILLMIYLIVSVPLIALLFIEKNRKTYFINSSIWTILCSLTFFKLGKSILSLFNILPGVINYTMYLYKYLFMFSPLLSLYFLSIHKCFAQKKQLIFLIALKCISPIILGLVFMHFLELSKLLWLLAILDLCTTLFAVFFSNRKN